MGLGRRLGRLLDRNCRFLRFLGCRSRGRQLRLAGLQFPSRFELNNARFEDLCQSLSPSSRDLELRQAVVELARVGLGEQFLEFTLSCHNTVYRGGKLVDGAEKAPARRKIGGGFAGVTQDKGPACAGSGRWLY